MPGLNFQMHDGPAMDGFGKLKVGLTDMRPAFRLIDKHVSTVFMRQFASEGGLGGMPWQRLRPSTVRARSKRGRGRGGILRDTNRLWASLVKSRGPETVRVIGSSEYVRGTTVKYARFHQHGTRGMPQRQIVPDPMPAHITRMWQLIITRHIAASSPDL